MKAWSRSLAILSVLALAPASAFAQSNEGFYASIGGLYVMPMEASPSYAEAGVEITAKVPLDSGPAFVAAVGYETSGPLRGELELGYRSSSWDKFKGLSGSSDVDIPGDLTTTSLMANGILSFGEAWRFKPYVGAGLGFARHSASIDAATPTVGSETLGVEGSSDDDTVFAHQLMLGVAYPLSDAAEVRLGYRYFGTGEGDFDGIKMDYGSHNLEVGVRFRF